MKLPRHLGQPFRIGNVGLTPGHVLDVAGIDHPGRNAGRLQMREDALPVNPRALQDHQFDLEGQEPGDQFLQVAFEAAELAGVFRHRAVVILDQHGDDVLHAMHIEPGDAFVDGFHIASPVVTLDNGRRAAIRPEMPQAEPRQGPLYRAFCHNHWRYSRGCEPVGTGPVRTRGKTAKRCATSRRTPPTPHIAPTRPGFHAQGRAGRS